MFEDIFQIFILFTNKTTLILTLFIITSLSENYYDVEIDERTYPPDLKLGLINKTEHDMIMQECMIDYITCKNSLNTHDKLRIFCAKSGYDQYMVFNNTCDMMYVTCKTKDEWHYQKDGDCNFF